MIWTAGNPRVTSEVTRDVCLLARMMAANLYFSQIEDLMFEVSTGWTYLFIYLLFRVLPGLCLKWLRL